MIRLSIFVILSVPILIVSWRSLRRPDSHGFYRFFAWEIILASFVLRADSWFQDPFSWHQIISWILLILCVLPLTLGVHALRTAGKPDRTRRPDSPLVGFERTTALVTGGIYSLIRHPLYGSLLLLAWGVFFKEPTPTGISLAAVATIFLWATARADERECLQTFGAAYHDYMQRTHMFIPYIF